MNARKGWSVAAAVVAAFLLAACAGDGKTLDARLADELLVEAEGPQARKLRLCMVGAAVAELAADRVVRFDPLEAPRVAAAIAGVERRLQAIRGDAAGLWLNTEMYEVKRLFVLAAEERLRGRVAQVLGRGGLGLIDLRRGLAALGKAEALVADMNRALERLRAGEIGHERLWRGCLGRIAGNRARVAALVEG